MAQVSKNHVSKEILAKLYRLFFQTVGNRRNINEFESISNDLFSKTEQLMLAKRIAIFYLLIKGIDHYTISKTLKVSTSTIAKFVLIKEKSTGLVPFLKESIKSENMKIFFTDLYNDVINTNWSSKFHHKWKRQIEMARGIKKTIR